MLLLLITFVFNSILLNTVDDPLKISSVQPSFDAIPFESNENEVVQYKTLYNILKSSVCVCVCVCVCFNEILFYMLAKVWFVCQREFIFYVGECFLLVRVCFVCHWDCVLFVRVCFCTKECWWEYVLSVYESSLDVGESVFCVSVRVYFI